MLVEITMTLWDSPPGAAEQWRFCDQVRQTGPAESRRKFRLVCF